MFLPLSVRLSVRFICPSVAPKFTVGVAKFCNQLLLEFSSNQSETLHKCYRHIKDVPVDDLKEKIQFLTKIWHFRQSILRLDFYIG